MYLHVDFTCTYIVYGHLDVLSIILFKMKETLW